MLAHVRCQVTDPAWPAGRRMLSDYRLADSSGITPDDLVAAATLYAPKAQIADGLRTAYLSSVDFTGPGVLQSTIAARYRLQPVEFGDLETACGWLGVEPAAAEAIIMELRAALLAHDAA